MIDAIVATENQIALIREETLPYAQRVMEIENVLDGCKKSAESRSYPILHHNDPIAKRTREVLKELGC